MKTLVSIFTLAGLFALSPVASAEVNRASVSTEGYKTGDLNKKTKVVELKNPLSNSGKRVKKTPKSLSSKGQVFLIYDAFALLNFDEDGDGFHHNFSVVFDADVEPGFAYVYADLYLSLEGGPWNHYFSTDDFSIEGSSDVDEYEVATELNVGYPSGYYDVLIELVDADTGELVDAVDSLDFAGLAALPLEDSERDALGLAVVSHGHGGGSLSWLLAGLALLGLRKRRAI